MKKVLVTGGAGFVGHHLIEQLLKKTDWEIVTLDRFDAAGNPNRLSEMLETTLGIDRKRVKFVFWDLKAALNGGVRKQLGGPFDYIMHLAAGSNVNKSIEDPLAYFMDNTIGAINLLDYARSGGLKFVEGQVPVFDGRFLYFSTDEVYGPAPFDMPNGFKEWDRHNPNNPYASSKSAAEMACISYAHTYKLPIVITNCMNIVGQRQDHEKYVPLVINKLLNGEQLSIHSDVTKTQAGKRHYLHARNICAAAIWLLEHGEPLDGSDKKGRYNIVGEEELDNLEMAQLITSMVNEWLEKNGQLKKELKYEMVSFHASRPGHDLRYSLDGKYLKEAGFSYPVGFKESLRQTVWWTLEHKDKWL